MTTQNQDTSVPKWLLYFMFAMSSAGVVSSGGVYLSQPVDAYQELKVAIAKMDGNLDNLVAMSDTQNRSLIDHESRLRELEFALIRLQKGTQCQPSK